MNFRADCSEEKLENVLVDFNKEKETLLIGINTLRGNFPHIVLSKNDTIKLVKFLNKSLQEQTK